MSENSNILQSALMSLIHEAMDAMLGNGMENSEAIAVMTNGLADCVAETMATLALCYATDDMAGREKFYTRFRKLVRATMTKIPPEGEGMPTPSPTEVVARSITIMRETGEEFTVSVH